jgi:hypothetical protein
MVNPEELAICKRRGHDPKPETDGWTQCRWCGIWHRKVFKIEEQEADPPKEERSGLEKLLTLRDRTA